MSTCPLKDGEYPGNCQFCEQKEDCILVNILHKVENLEKALDRIVSLRERVEAPKR